MNSQTYLAGILVAAWAASASFAQNPRPSVSIVSGANVKDPAISTGASLTAVAYVDDDLEQVFVSTSDGRGLSWSAPVRVDSDTTGAQKSIAPSGVAVVDSTIYVLWSDQRFGGSETMILNTSSDAGATWDGEQLPDQGLFVGAGSVSDAKLVVLNGGGTGDRLSILFKFDPGSSIEDLYYLRSSDGGVTFQAPVYLPGVATDVDELGLVAAGLDLEGAVYVAWEDDRTGIDNVYFRQSQDGGETWSSEIQVSTSSPISFDAEGSVAVDGMNGTIVVSWVSRDLTGATPDGLRAAISHDGGLTFGTDFLIGSYPGGTNVRDGHVVMNALGTLIASWIDDRSGSDELYASISTDGGLTFGPDAVTLTSAPYGGIWNGGWWGSTCLMVDGFKERSYDCDIHIGWIVNWFTAVGLTSGTPDGPPIILNDSLVEGRGAATFNPLYGNIIVIWPTGVVGGPGLSAAGYRPQTIEPEGFGFGQPSSFSFSSFLPDPVTGSAALGFAVAAAGTGSLPLPLGDGRDLGIAFDVLTQTTLVNPGLFTTPLLPDGTGSTAPFPSTLPPGYTFQVVGLSLFLTTGTFGQISDVTQVVAQ